MSKMSAAQTSLVEKIGKGATLVHEAGSTGLFRLTEDGVAPRTIHPSTVESLIAAGVLFKDLMGRVRVVK